LLLPTERLTWMLLAAGIRTRVTVGLKLNQVLTLMKTVSRHKYVPLRHEADYCLDLGRRVGVSTDNLATEVFLSPDERREGAALLKAHGIEAGPGLFLVGLHPGSGNSAPNWTVEKYAKLAGDLLKDLKCRIIITGSEGERELGEAFHFNSGGRLVNLIGTLSVRVLMTVIAQLSVLVSASTGPMHIAAALRVPTVSLFCPLTACSPVLWGPQGNVSRVILPVDGFCQGKCSGDPHQCRFDGGIDVATVAAAIHELRPPASRLPSTI
jgi:heptosyltransferase-2